MFSLYLSESSHINIMEAFKLWRNFPNKNERKTNSKKCGNFHNKSVSTACNKRNDNSPQKETICDVQSFCFAYEYSGTKKMYSK